MAESEFGRAAAGGEGRWSADCEGWASASGAAAWLAVRGDSVRAAVVDGARRPEDGASAVGGASVAGGGAELVGGAASSGVAIMVAGEEVAAEGEARGLRAGTFAEADGGCLLMGGRAGKSSSVH